MASKCVACAVGRALFLFPILVCLIGVEHFDPTSSVKQSRLTDFNNANTSEAKKAILSNSKIAVCLVGEGKHFDLTGSSFINNVIGKYPHVDLFVSTTMDSNTYKFALLESVPRIVAIHFLDGSSNSITMGYLYNPKSSLHSGLQEMLQIFEMQFRCLELILDQEIKNEFKYDWILHMRTDGYWWKPLDVDAFHATKYTAPKGSRFGGLNDRFGIGARSSGVVSLGRYLKWIDLMEKGHRNLTSEWILKKMLHSSKLAHREITLPFCVMSDRTYPYPPEKHDVPVAFIGSKGMLSGAECRPCIAKCIGLCAEHVGTVLEKDWGWIEVDDGITLCDGSVMWEPSWERIFDAVATPEVAKTRKTIINFTYNDCIRVWNNMMARKNLSIRNEKSPRQICSHLPHQRNS